MRTISGLGARRASTGIDDPATATAREDLTVLLASLWLTVGLFLDGYAHENLLDGDETFLTPWHAVFYAGFAAVVTALWRIAERRRSPGQALVEALPPGYRPAALGVALFAAGGAGDAVWHSRYGVESGIHALLSPTHLVLFAGLVLVLTAPYRAAADADVAPDAPASWRGSWRPLLSVLLTTSLVGFFCNFVWGLGTAALTRVPYDPVSQAGEDQVIAAVASTLVSTIVLFGAALFVLGRVRPPLGAFTILFGFVALAVAAAFDEDPAGIAAAVVAGLVADVALRARRQVGPALVASAVAMWLVFYALVAADGPIAWDAEIWTGAVVLNGLAVLAMVQLARPGDRLLMAATPPLVLGSSTSERTSEGA